MNVFNLLFYAVSVIPFIALPFLLVNCAKYVKARAENRLRFVLVPVKFPTASVLFFVVPIIVVITIAEIMTFRSRVEVLNFLRDLSGKYEIYVNSQPLTILTR